MTPLADAPAATSWSTRISQSPAAAATPKRARRSTSPAWSGLWRSNGSRLPRAKATTSTATSNLGSNRQSAGTGATPTDEPSGEDGGGEAGTGPTTHVGAGG